MGFIESSFLVLAVRSLCSFCFQTLVTAHSSGKEATADTITNADAVPPPLACTDVCVDLVRHT